MLERIHQPRIATLGGVATAKTAHSGNGLVVRMERTSLNVRVPATATAACDRVKADQLARSETCAPPAGKDVGAPGLTPQFLSRQAAGISVVSMQ